ncbi:MAG: CopG family transcriptional regulator [Bacteroidetes bacterium GWF2_49_14]|nr:MAG: CopG family transcriptional regulator [Bacteroidetes bacterium GWF2_49_14]HBB90759.1 CopG family transcriptional regulator [Bacteroidales bacterium]
MEKRIGSVLILLADKLAAPQVNSIISNHSSIIIGRQGLPVRDSDIGIISLVLEGTTDQIGSLTGQLGRLQGVEVKSVVLKIKDKNE